MVSSDTWIPLPEDYRDRGIDDLDVSLFDQDFSRLETELLDFFFSYRFAALELSDLTR